MAQIDHYEFGRIVVDGRQETRDLIILPDRMVRNWWRQDGHALVLDDLADVLDELPGHLVVGTGADGRMRPDPGAIRQLQERGVTVEILPTSQAVRRFGELDPAGAAAALHLLLARGAGDVDPVREIYAGVGQDSRSASRKAAQRAGHHRRDTIGA
jgi:hypothetical protein